MNRHAGPPPDPNAPPPPPEPTYAERARTLVHRARTGTLATLSRRHAGYPFASLMPYALDQTGRPIFLISSMAVHTQNLEGDPRASLFVAEPDWSGDPLAAGRITLMGGVTPVPAEERAEARAAYLARHANAAYWVDFEDFAFHRLEVEDLYFVGGFAAMDWITATAYRAARVDPLADVAADILEHMNKDHPEALVTYARDLGGAPDAEAATMVAVDRLGFRLRIRSGGRLHAERIPFPEEVRSADDARRVLIRMLQDLRART
jgi:heme oxygenase (biliverdin-IX-beta and delta-forming)